MFYRFSLISLLLVLGGWYGFETYQAPKKQTNIIFLSVESLRFDLLSEAIAPKVIEAAQDATVFTKHRGSSAWTGAGIASMLSGRNAFEHGVHSGKESYSWREPSLLMTLKERGYEIAGLQPFMSNGNFKRLGVTYQSGQKLKPWLVERAKAKSPFVLWYHYLDTHLPYSQRKENFQYDWEADIPDKKSEQYKRIEAVASYPNIPGKAFSYLPEDQPIIRRMHEASVAEFNAWFNEFWGFLTDTGLLQNSILILTADHGDEHGERGMVGHASTTKVGHLYEELVHVPLMIWLPEGRPSKEPSPDNWTAHEDIMPALLDILDGKKITQTRFFEKRSSPWLGMTSKAGFSERELDDQKRYVFAAYDKGLKLHAQKKDQGEWQVKMFDLNIDPFEKTDISQKHSQEKAKLLAALDLEIKRTWRDQSQQKEAMMAAPNWVFPANDQKVSYDDLNRGCFTLKWTDVGAPSYELEYEAGTGVLAASGVLEFPTSQAQYCDISYLYWKTFITPYEQVKIRVRAQRSEKWSEWLELRIKGSEE